MKRKYLSWLLFSGLQVGSVVLILVILNGILLITPEKASAASNPTVDSVTTAIVSGGTDQSSIALVENSTKTIYIHGSATDVDDCGEIDALGQWVIKSFRTDVTDQQNCTLDKNDCYSASSGTLTNCAPGSGDLDIDYEGEIDLQYYADPTDAGSPHSATDWTNFVKVTDDTSKVGWAIDSYEMESLIALTVTSSVDYGTVALGADSAEQTINFTNTGNRAIDADQTADGDMICDGPGSENIAVGNAHLSFTPGFTYGVGDQALTTTATTVELNMAQRTNDSIVSVRSAYLILRMPADGVGGTCTNTITFTAKADT